MGETLESQKAALRGVARAALRDLTPGQKAEAALRLRERLVSLPIWKSARSILMFSPRPDEPDIWPLVEPALSEGKTIALPRFIAATASYAAAAISNPAAELVPGQFGILEPLPVCNVADPKRLDLVFVPGLAFDWHGHRLGRGKGFYDRLLTTVSGKTCGVAFDSQLVSAIPVEPHDVRLNCILTPAHWLEF